MNGIIILGNETISSDIYRVRTKVIESIKKQNEVMKKNLSKSDRRCFLSNCAKISVGIPLLGLSIKSFADVTDSYLDYSYCIYKCPQPCSYDSSCSGCRSNDTLTCSIKLCAIEKNLPSCAHCTLLATCDQDLWINYPGQRSYALGKQAEWNLISGVEKTEIKQHVFQVYPTTSDQGFTIKNTNQLSVNYNLISVEGKMIQKGKFKTKEHYITISDLPKGIYILNIFHDDELIYISKIKKK